MKETSIKSIDTPSAVTFQKVSRDEKERWYLRTSGCYVKGMERADLSGTFIISVANFSRSFSFSLSFSFPSLEATDIFLLPDNVPRFKRDAARSDNKKIVSRDKTTSKNATALMYHILHFRRITVINDDTLLKLKILWRVSFEKLSRLTIFSPFHPLFLRDIFDYSGESNFSTRSQFSSWKKENFIMPRGRERCKNNSQEVIIV